MLMKEIKTIAFVGTGVMGRSMALHLLEAGYKLRVHTRTPVKAGDVLDAGAELFDSPAQAMKHADAAISIVGFVPDVEEVYFSEHGLLKEAKNGDLLIDMTTSTPSLAERIAREAEGRGADALDAPVSGGDSGAREARLSIMVGGQKAAFERALPLFEAMGKKIVYQGKPGSGQHAKACNQIAIAGTMAGMCEALKYAKESGLNPKTVLESISGGAAGSWSLSNLAPRILDSDMEPGFYVKHFIKDMNIAIEESSKRGVDLSILRQVRGMYQRLADEMGGAEQGTQALMRFYEEKR